MGAQGTAGFGGGIGGIIMLVAMFAVMYFLLIRPQKKKEKETKQMIAALGVGDTITTIGGIIGKIIKIKEDEVFLQTGKTGNPNEQSVIRFAKWAIRDVVKKAEVKEAALPEADGEADTEESAE